MTKYNWNCKVQGKLKCENILEIFQRIKCFEKDEYIFNSIKFYNFKENKRAIFNVDIESRKYTVIIFYGLTFQICSVQDSIINGKMMSCIELSSLIIKEFISNMLNDEMIIDENSLSIISICATHPSLIDNSIINLDKSAKLMMKVHDTSWSIQKYGKNRIDVIFKGKKGTLFIYSTGTFQVMGGSSIEDIDIMFDEYRKMIPIFTLEDEMKKKKRKRYIVNEINEIKSDLLDELCFHLGI